MCLYSWEAQLHPKTTVRIPLFPSFLFLMGKANLVRPVFRIRNKLDLIPLEVDQCCPKIK